MGWGTSGKGMVKEDKGMRQRDWCLCVHVWSCVFFLSFFLSCVCLCVYENLMCAQGWLERASNPQGVWDWEGNGELGLWEYEVEMEEGEKDMLEDGREKVEEEWKGQINAGVQKKTQLYNVRKDKYIFQSSWQRALPPANSRKCHSKKQKEALHWSKPLFEIITLNLYFELFKEKRIWSQHADTLLISINTT